MYSYEEESELEIQIQNVQLKQEKWADFIAMTGDVTYSSEETEGVEEGPFGDFSLVIYDTDWTKNIHVAADEYSSHRIEAYSQLGFNGEDYKDSVDYLGRINAHGRVALLKNFTVYEKYRHNGFGTAFMKELIWYLHTIMHVNYILLHAHPYQRDLPFPPEDESEMTPAIEEKNIEYINTKKVELSKFYKKFNYKHTGDVSLNYMVLSVDNYVSAKKEKWSSENIETDLFENISTLKLSPKERGFWLELFQFFKDIDGDEIVSGCDEKTFVNNLLSFHFSNEMIEMINEWGGNKRKVLEFNVSPYVLYFLNGYLDMFSDMHSNDDECNIYTQGNCDTCSLLEKYQNIFSEQEPFYMWGESAESLMDTYKDLLSEERINKLYFKFEEKRRTCSDKVIK